MRDEAPILATVNRLEEAVATLTAKLAEVVPQDGPARVYQPSPTPQVWRLHAEARERLARKLSAWVQDVYRPLYGHLAARLPACWPQHDLAIVILDVLSELQLDDTLNKRTPGVLVSQGEFTCASCRAWPNCSRPSAPDASTPCRSTGGGPHHDPPSHGPRSGAHRRAAAEQPPGSGAARRLPSKGPAPPAAPRPGQAGRVMTGQEHADPRLNAALRYARANWPVFPCIPGEKVPVTAHGFLDATTDPDKITWCWSRHPDRNVAIATGQPGPGRARRGRP